MSFLYKLTTLCTYLSLSSALPTSIQPLCPPNLYFRLEALAVRQYLTPGAPCEPDQGYPCSAFFSVGNTTRYEYTIESGAHNLMIARTPPGDEYETGFYIDAPYPNQVPNIISVSPSKSVYLKCTVVPDLEDIGTCNLECEGPSGGTITHQLSIGTSEDNE